MKRRFCALLAAFAFVAVLAAAHGDKKHVIGTIQKLDSGSITVKTRDGKSVEVKLVASTAYVKRVDTADKPAVISDLTVGENVVIHATPKGNDLEADEVRFSEVPARATAPKSQP
jgi:ABC-type multidrug transport system ATPase subunit